MESLWNDQESAKFPGDLGQRVYTSRLLGREPALVLHGGGNTSVKIVERDLLGHEETVLYVKGSGYDLETITAEGFSPVRMHRLLELATLDSLPDPEMVNELRAHMKRADAPTPSVEAILHAVIPHRYVDHTHADIIVATTNAQCGLERIQELYEDRVLIIPYVMPGFDLARVVAERFAAEANENTIGMVLMHHGIFTFGETAKESYERMIELVSQAEIEASDFGATDLPLLPGPIPAGPQRLDIAQLRAEISTCAGFPVVMSTHQDPLSMTFARLEGVEVLSQQGPVTPDHVIRTKRVPMLGRDVKSYAKAYKAYFDELAPRAKEAKTMLDPAPRVVIDRDLGVCSVGRTAKDAGIVFDIYRHTMEIIRCANALGGYHALPAKDIFDVEYWDLEQAKLRRGGKAPAFTGEVALVTGAASGIGKACVEALLGRGAAVVGLDIDTAVSSLFSSPAYLGVKCDITQPDAVDDALERGVHRFGGLDMLVLNAGVFPESRAIDALTLESWRGVLAVNVDANLVVMGAAHPLLKLAPLGGRVVVIGSRNVLAPGPGAAAYSSSKAALNQLARVAALEWGQQGIRVNILHPDGVFDTGIWSDDVLKSRAAAYGISVDQYKTRNTLGVEVSSRDVAELAAELCGPLFAKVTGAQIPVDGGNDRVI